MKWRNQWQRSLFSRLAMTHFLLVLAFQALAMSLSFHFVVAPLLRTSAQDLTALLALSVHGWEAQPLGQRAAYAAQLEHNYGLALHPAQAPQDSAPGWLPYGHILQTALRQRFGNSASVRVSYQPDPVYLLEIPTSNQRLQVTFPHSRVGTEPYPAILLTLLLSGVLGLGAALLLARRLTRPLRKLGDVALQIGAGEKPAASLPQDIAELDALAQTFSRMAQQVEQLLNNRTTLLAGVSHDLRSPITRLRMALELAKSQLEPEQYDNMERYLEQMNQLIADYLDFAQSGTRRPLQPVELASVLRQLCESAGKENPVKFSGDELTVMAAPLALERTVGNLIDNAVRYGAPPVEVGLKADGSQAVITVADHGPGIPQAEQEKLFQAFTRLESSRNPATGGTGLGLAIVNELCRLYGWHVSLRDTRGGGVTVRLVLPIKEA